MFVATLTVTIVLAALLVFAAARKLSHREPVVQSYRTVGVPEDRLDQLAYLLLAGAAGLLAGLVWAPAGIAAGIGVICYFVGAIIFHLRAGDAKNLANPVAYEAAAIAALVLRLVTL